MYNRNHLKQIAVKLLNIAADLLTIAVVCSILIWLRKILGGDFKPSTYLRLWPFLILFWLVFEKLGLYNGASIHSGACLGPVEEFRRIFYALTTVFLMLGFGNYCYRPDNYLYSRSILIGSFLICLIAVPVQRVLFRKLCIRRGCWGVPVVLIGSGETARALFINISRHPEYGLRPLGYFTDTRNNTMPESAIFMGTLSEIPEKTKTLAVKYAILCKEDGIDSPYIQDIIKQYGILFPHLLLIPKALLQTSTGVALKDIGGTIGLEIRHNLQIPSVYRIKRVIDYLLTIPCLIAALPVMGILIVWVKLDSPGPVFFKHRRITGNGGEINIYKFRTMVAEASENMNTLFDGHPERQEEWEKYGKLQHDPRITRSGRWLRKTSLDELPQLFNVLQGKLTLVGPRPIVRNELVHYGDEAGLFDQVRPGITGLWQVSGRNKLTYADRVKLDLYYVNNWSVWLDLYILAKTVYAVFFRHGAR